MARILTLSLLLILTSAITGCGSLFIFIPRGIDAMYPRSTKPHPHAYQLIMTDVATQQQYTRTFTCEQHYTSSSLRGNYWAWRHATDTPALRIEFSDGNNAIVEYPSCHTLTDWDNAASRQRLDTIAIRLDSGKRYWLKEHEGVLSHLIRFPDRTEVVFQLTLKVEWERIENGAATL